RELVGAAMEAELIRPKGASARGKDVEILRQGVPVATVVDALLEAANMAGHAGLVGVRARLSRPILDPGVNWIVVGPHQPRRSSKKPKVVDVVARWRNDGMVAERHQADVVGAQRNRLIERTIRAPGATIQILNGEPFRRAGLVEVELFLAHLVRQGLDIVLV